MAIRLEQGYEYKGKEYWEWWVWVDGPEQDLDQIEYVEYTLHPTFPRPVRRITDRSSKFRLKTAGWGVFTIYAKVGHKNKRQTMLEHFLQLSYPDDTPAPGKDT
jgi:transcription initiation factor IIF auxiliary subunit